jgi:hypothetical protein
MDESSKAFRDFLAGLSKEPSARSSFQDDPVGAMDRAGLTDAQKIALLSQDEGKIQNELGGEVDSVFRIRVIVTLIVEF